MVFGLWIGGQRYVEAAGEALRELVVIGGEAGQGSAVGGRDGLDCGPVEGERGGDHVHRREQRVRARVAGEQIRRLGVGQGFIGGELGAAFAGEGGLAAAAVGPVRLECDETLFFQATEQAAQQARVEAKIGAQVGQVGRPASDGVQHARRSERAAAAEEGRVEQAGRGRHGAVKAAGAGDGVCQHRMIAGTVECLTIVKHSGGSKGRVPLGGWRISALFPRDARGDIGGLCSRNCSDG